MIAGESLNDVYKLNTEFLHLGFKTHFTHIEDCQHDWLSNILPDISCLPDNIKTLYRRSLLIIKTQVDHKGAIIAANDSDIMQFNRDTYSYMWPRDGALVAIALIKAGFADMAKPFFIFCRDVLYKEGCLLHKYNPDRTLGSSWHPWVYKDMESLPIQEDETALVLHALWIFFKYSKNKEFVNALYPSLIKPMGDFLNKYRYANGLPRESYDLWEERRGILTFTTSAVLAGLLAADKFGALYRDESFCEECAIGFKIVKKAMIDYLYNKDAGYFRRSVSFENGQVENDDTMDSSVYSLFEFDVFDIEDEMVTSTMQKMKEWMTVKTEVGGLARYYNDYYMQKSGDLQKVPGNPWFICTLWYAKYIIKKAKHVDDLKEALDMLKWTADHALSTGVLAEQLHPYTGEPLSVSPLTWSHAEFIDTCTNYANKYSELTGNPTPHGKEEEEHANHTHHQEEL
jgi:GH15 family glucan-1,4-alpha-glucosidase